MQLAEDASPDFPCTPYADYLVAYIAAGTEGSSDMGDKALGAPDADPVPLAANSTLTVAFLGLGGIVDKSGQDLTVHGTVNGEVAVYVGQDETNLVFSGSLAADKLTVDLSVASATTASFVRLVGITGEASIDAFEVVQTSCNDQAPAAVVRWPQQSAGWHTKAPRPGTNLLIVGSQLCRSRAPVGGLFLAL